MTESKESLTKRIKELEDRCDTLETELDAKHELYIKLYALYNKDQEKIGKIMAILRGDK